MSELVTITPVFDRDDDGNPVPNGSPADVWAFAVAPGNTTVTFTDSGNVDSADFTVYFVHFGVSVKDGDLIRVRNRDCTARVQEWNLNGRGGMVILCMSDAGAS